MKQSVQGSIISGRFCDLLRHCMSPNCSLWSLCINLTWITLLLGGLSRAPFKKFATRGYLHKRISLQSHKTLLPQGHVNTKKLINVLKTCRLCPFISDNQSTTLDVLRLSLFLQEKQTKNAAEITVKWSFTFLFRKAYYSSHGQLFLLQYKCSGTYLKHPTR